MTISVRPHSGFATLLMLPFAIRVPISFVDQSYPSSQATLQIGSVCISALMPSSRDFSRKSSRGHYPCMSIHLEQISQSDSQRLETKGSGWILARRQRTGLSSAKTSSLSRDLTPIRSQLFLSLRQMYNTT